MKRNIFGIAAVIIVLAVSLAIAANTPAKPKPKVTLKALPRLLDLGATTCVPCKMMAKVLDELKVEYKGKLKVDFIDVRIDTAAVEKYNVKLIPLQIFYNAKGKELFRHEGYWAKAEVVKKFKELGINLTK